MKGKGEKMKHLKMLFLSSMVILFTACGGGGGSSSPVGAVPINPDTPQSIAIDKIMAYADDSTLSAPTIEDYIDAGVTGVTSENIDDINEVVASLTAEDVDTTEKIKKIVDDLGINILPTANAGPDKSVEVSQSVTITGSATDIDGTIVSYEWKKDTTVLATTASFDYLPTVVGTDTLTLTVKDDDGVTASDSMKVTVTSVPNIPPVANAGADQSIQVNESVTITGTGNDIDGHIVSYVWEKGSAVVATTASFDYLPTVVGTDTLTLTVKDDDGVTASDSMKVTVTSVPNIPPVANAGADQSIQVNESVTITGTGNDIDGHIVSYVWEKGSAVVATTASFTYTPTTVGTDTLTLTVTDNDGVTASDSIIIRIVDIFSELNKISVGSEKILTIPTYDGANQVVHPDILIKDNKFYLVITPYPYSDDKYENPSFYESDNGIDFIPPEGLENPLVPAPDYDHNDDPDMIYNKQNNMYYIYYLETLRPDYQHVALLNSNDGINWDKNNIITYDLQANDAFIVSPALIIKDNNYSMFYVDISEAKHKIRYIESTDGIKWEKEKVNDINIDLPVELNPWHIDIFEKSGKYYMLIDGYEGTSVLNHHNLYIALSDDLINWKFISKPIIVASKEFYNSEMIYRSTGLINDNNVFVWFSFRTYDNTWHLGIKKISLDILK